jgi:hypothetical protein
MAVLVISLYKSLEEDKQTMLNKKALKSLRKEIVLNSLYYSDYENSMGIDKHNVCNFFESYVEYLGEIIEENHGNVSDKQWFKLMKKYDTIENLECYYMMYDIDPLLITINDAIAA